MKNKERRRTYGFGDIDNRYLISALGAGSLGLIRDKGPQFVSVDNWAVVDVILEMEFSHTKLSEETRMAKQ